MHPYLLCLPLWAIAVSADVPACEDVSMLQASQLPNYEPLPTMKGIMKTPKDFRIAVYTENIGGYDEVRKEYIAKVPPGIDAFYFVDGEGMAKNQERLKRWEDMGWTVKRFEQVEGTKYVNAPRLTGKKLKFSPPDWLVTSYDWLIHHDANLRVNLDQLQPFLRARQDSALILLDYCYEYPQCCGSGHGLKCFKHSTDFYINEAPKLSPEKIMTSLNKLKWWRWNVVEKVKTKEIEMPYFYKLNIIIRNLKHPKAAEVKDVFDQTYEKCHNMQRDQPVLPFYLGKSNLTADVAVVSMEKLVEVTSFRKISGHTFVDL